MKKIESNFIGRMIESSSSSEHKENVENTCTNNLKGKLNELFQSSVKI